MLLMCLLLSGINTAWGETIVYTLNAVDSEHTGTNNTYTGNCDITVDGITWNVTGNASMAPWRIGGKSITNVDRTVYSKTAFSSALSKIDLTVGAASSITVNSLKLVYSTNADFSNSTEILKTFAANSTISFEADFPVGAYYKFVFNVTVSGTSNKFVEFRKVEFYSAGGTTPEPEDATWTFSTDEVQVKERKSTAISVNTNYDGELSVSSSNTDIATASISDKVITVTGVAEGVATLTVSGEATGAFNAISKTIDVIVLHNDRPVNEIFYESFDHCNSTGGNDGSWNGNISMKPVLSDAPGTENNTDNGGWVFTKGYSAKACARFGNESNCGSAITPALGYQGNAILVFKAAAWNAQNEHTTLNISVIGGGEASNQSVTIKKGQWTDFAIPLKDLTVNSKVEFRGVAEYNSRFFLDEVCVLSSLNTMDQIYATASTVGGIAADVKVAFDNWVVSGLNGGKNAYLTDNNGKGLIIFANDANHGFEVGDVLSGTVDCKVQMYNGSAELIALTSTSDGLSITKNGEVVEQAINISSLEGVNTGALLSYEELTYHLNGSDAEFSDGENVIAAYKGIMGSLPELVEGRTYNVKGIFLMYGTKKEILPRSADDIVLVQKNYVVTYGTTENGTIVVKNGENVISSGDNVAEGTELTIECTPANADYRFKSWEYKKGDGEWVVNTSSFDFTMPSANVQFRATFELIPVYAISWSVNGNKTTESYKEGTTLVPPTVEEIYGKVFTGWVTSASVDANTEPDYVKPSSATAPATYYAVYATKRGEEVLREFTFTIDTDDFNGTSYAANNGSHIVEAIASDGTTLSVNYISENVMLSSKNIQFKGNAGYLYNTTDLGSIKSITLSESNNLAVYYGDTKHPTEGTATTGGYFTVSYSASNIGTTKSITVVFEKATGATYSHFTTQVRVLALSDNIYSGDVDDDFDAVTVQRTIKPGSWVPMCLPFNMDAEQIAVSFRNTTVEVRELTGLKVTGNTYAMIFSTVESIRSGVPFLIKVSNETSQILVNDVHVDYHDALVTDEVNAGDEKVVFTGSYVNFIIPLGAYASSGGKLIYSDLDDWASKGFRGYFEITNASSPKYLTYIFPEIPTYTINWSVNGKYDTPVTLTEGSDLEVPSVENIYGKVCTGWVTTPTVDPDNTPVYVDFDVTKATGKFTFYAVFATKSGEDSETTQELTENEIVELGLLAYETEKRYEDGDIAFNIHAFKDQPARKWLQLKKDQGAYIKITAPSAIKKVSLIISSASNSSGGINDITKHTAFSGTVALTTSDCTYSTSSVSVASTSSIADNVAVLVPNSDNNELYLKVSSGARIWGITVLYGESAYYSKFTTLVKVLSLDENVVVIPQEMEICDSFDAVIINRFINKDTWSTLCLPFAMDENQIAETFGKNADVRTLSGLTVNGNNYTMNFTRVTSIKEGTPYMIRLDEPVNKIVAKDVDVYYYDDDYCDDDWSEDNNNCVVYHGRYVKQTIEQSPNNYIISGNKFYFVNSEVTNKGFRGWFEILSDGSSAPTLGASFDDETNGITTTVVNTVGNDGLYNIAGQRVSNAHKGVFIKGGKKYVIK